MFVYSFNWIDVVFVCLVLLSAFAGYNRGFFCSLFSTVGWVLSFLITYSCYPFIEPILKERIDSEFLIYAVGYGGVLLISLMLFSIFNMISLRSLGKIRQSAFDRVFGLCFGIVRGFGVAIILFSCFALVSALLHGEKINSEEVLPGFILKSQSYKLLSYGNTFLIELLPESLSQKIENIGDEVNKNKEKAKENDLLDAIAKIAKYTDPNTLAEIRKKAKTDSSKKSNIEIAKVILKGLLDEYHNKGSKRDFDKAMPEDELEMITKILKE